MRDYEILGLVAIAIVLALLIYFMMAKGPIKKITIINETVGDSGTTNITNTSAVTNATNTTNVTEDAESPGKIAITNPDGSLVEISAEIADNMATRMKGLMGRKSMDEDAGMLFVFGTSGRHAFWMFNTSIALDAIFIDENGSVVDIIQMEPCGLNAPACPTYTPKADSKYVLEVNQGFSERHGITIGKSRMEKYGS